MDRQVADVNKNKSDGRDLWWKWFCLGSEEYKQGYDIDDYPADVPSKTCLQEWKAGWNEAMEKDNVGRE